MAKASSMTVWAGPGEAGGMFMAQVYGIFSHLQDLQAQIRIFYVLPTGNVTSPYWVRSKKKKSHCANTVAFREPTHPNEGKERFRFF
jgi:hypothetical protein